MSNRFRDPIHGFIEVSPTELQIINSAPFQRLRNIKQLATSYLVYHGAEHTRFGHSLGVMHLVTRAFNAAVENYEAKTNEKLFDDITKVWYRQILRLIALTHDLGHAPFSHASEALFVDDFEHEDFTKKIIFETEIGHLIYQVGKEFQSKYGLDDKYDITPELLWLIYGEKKPELLPNYIMPDYKFLKSFMNSELDCDKMDYLLRDSYYCGVNYGKYDINRLLSSLDVYYLKNDNIMQLAIKRGGIHAFEEFVIARYFMFIQVYFHKTRRYLDYLLQKNIIKILPESKYPVEVQEYLKWDDSVVIRKLREEADKGNQEAKDFLERTVMTCVYETKAHCNHKSDEQFCNAIRDRLRSEIGEEVIKDAAEKIPHKLPIMEEYDASSGKGIPIIVHGMEKPSSIGEESLLLSSLVKTINIRRLYVRKKVKADADKIVTKMLC